MKSLWHPEAVPKRLMTAIRALARHPWSGDFYLAGGTGLALHLGHRLSMDVDFFSAKNRLSFAERETIVADLRSAAPLRVQEGKDGTMHLVVRSAAVSLLRYDYPFVKPLRSWEGIPIASVEDIALMKLGAVIGRGARKDFIDLYAVTREMSLAHLLDLSRKKFPDSRDFIAQALKALVYFDDAEKDPMPRLLKPVVWNDIVRFFEAEVPRSARELLDQ